MGLVVLLFISSHGFSYAKENNKFDSKSTIGNIEQIVIEYISENSLSIELGTKEYMEFLLLQLIEDADSTLASHPKYKEVCAYASIYLNELDKAQMYNDFIGDKVFILDQFVRDKTLEKVQIEVKEKEQNDKREAGKELDLNILSSYNSTAAANYAIEWGNGRNGLYNSHLKDCTNFVSQAVSAGGKSQEFTNPVPTGITNTTTQWYSIRYEEWHTNHFVYRWKESSSWIGVDACHSYWTRKGASSTNFTTRAAVQNYARVGDVVQLKNSNGAWYHSIMITKIENGVFYYSGQSKTGV